LKRQDGKKPAPNGPAACTSGKRPIVDAGGKAAA